MPFCLLVTLYLHFHSPAWFRHLSFCCRWYQRSAHSRYKARSETMLFGQLVSLPNSCEMGYSTIGQSLRVCAWRVYVCCWPKSFFFSLFIISRNQAWSYHNRDMALSLSAQTPKTVTHMLVGTGREQRVLPLGFPWGPPFLCTLRHYYVCESTSIRAGERYMTVSYDLARGTASAWTRTKSLTSSSLLRTTSTQLWGEWGEERKEGKKMFQRLKKEMVSREGWRTAGVT